MSMRMPLAGGILVKIKKLYLKVAKNTPLPKISGQFFPTSTSRDAPAMQLNGGKIFMY
jgi:hypothetical protein